MLEVGEAFGGDEGGRAVWSDRDTPARGLNLLCIFADGFVS